MPITLLLDLDGTLLDTNTEVFLPEYYGALADYLRDLVPPEAMLDALSRGVRQMMSSRDPTCSLQNVFEAEFYPRLGPGADLLRARIVQFYREVFPGLGSATRPQPGARELLDWAISAGHNVALATDPLFPMVATAERVRWAGLDPRRFELISSIETFHFTKTHPAYYAEMLGRLGWPDQPVLMAGNDVDRDLGTAERLGLTTFHISMSGNGSVEPAGDLLQLRQWIDTHGSSLEPLVFKTPEALLAVLEASPAALQGMTADLSPVEWTHEASADDWAMVELVCHLRDTEREVHAQQISTLMESSEPFVARPDAAVWAKQRRYLREDCVQALGEFAAARAACVERLSQAPAEIWSKPARHAIFGPSSFLEVIGFIAEHDRLHLRQAGRTFQAVRTGSHRK